MLEDRPDRITVSCPSSYSSLHVLAIVEICAIDTSGGSPLASAARGGTLLGGCARSVGWLGGVDDPIVLAPVSTISPLTDTCLPR
jgi:hypothetical protein